MWVTRLSIVDWVDIAGDLEDSKSTFGGVLCFSEAEHLPPSVECARTRDQYPTNLQTEIISLDAGLRMDGLFALDLWDFVIEVLHSSNNTARDKVD